MARKFSSTLSLLRVVRFAAAMTTGLLLAPIPPANAYPFKSDPDSFARYLDGVNWNSGSRYNFQNLHNCGSYTRTPGLRFSWDLNKAPSYEEYACTGGFVTITDPQGRKVCKLTWASWNKRDRAPRFLYDNCRYR